MALDLSNATILAPENVSGPEKKAVMMLIEEVEKRTQLRWKISTTRPAARESNPSDSTAYPSNPQPLIVVGTADKLRHVLPSYSQEIPNRSIDSRPEGYRIVLSKRHSAPALFVIGNDSRGVLFGVGHLLRILNLKTGSVVAPDGLNIATSPKYPLRGHQLGYRPKTNSYDAWDVDQWEQYIRDLVVFGCNAIELIPPRSDDAAWSPHFHHPPMEMMIEMSRLADSYGLDVWIWYPAMDKDYSDPHTVAFALKEWGEVFQKLPRVDVVFVPGGDPGHTQPKYLMHLLEEQKRNLNRYHPKAQMWVSPQSFNREWLDEFLGLLKKQHPAWLNGVVFG